ncbi:MAG: alpha/beta hydrolase [Alphaproteobacteria bacterium]|nr:alpha/beta hydrolase [Alphaproteobacteria bacterium]
MDVKRNILMAMLRMSKKGFAEASAPAPGGMTYEEALSRILKLRAGIPFFERILKIICTMPSGVVKKNITLDHVPTLQFTPEKSSGKVILFIHGGAWIYGTIYSYHLFSSQLAKSTHRDVYLIDYRLSPEHPYPAALEDAFAAYTHLLAQGHKPQDITVVGDSAGGNMTLALMLKLKMEKVPLPGAVVTMSPLTNMNFTYESYHQLKEQDPLLAVTDRAIVDFCYNRETSIDNPLVSPVLGDLGGLPPMLILVGGREILRDDSIEYAKAAKKAGVSVTLDLEEDMFHAYPIFYDILEESKMAMGKIVLFLKEHTR